MIRLNFFKLPEQNTILNPHQIRSLLLDIGIKCEPDEDPVIAWIIAMHEQNNIPYIPGLIDFQIVQEIESNPDLLHFIEIIGLDIHEEESEKSNE